MFKFENGPMPVPAIGGTGQTVDLPGHNLSFALASTLGPTMFNEVRLGYTYFPTVFDIPIAENLQSRFGIKGAPGDTLNDGRDNGFARFTPGDGPLCATSIAIGHRAHSHFVTASPPAGGTGHKRSSLRRC